MKDNINRINAIAEHIGDSLSAFLTDTGHNNQTADMVHRYAREVVKNVILEECLSNGGVYLFSAEKSSAIGNVENIIEKIPLPSWVDGAEPTKVQDEEPDVRDIQEEIASGFYDDDVLAIPLSKDNYWCSPIDGRPHYVDDDGWIYGRGYQPVAPDAVIIREAVVSGGLPYETRTSAKYFGWANVKRFKIDK